MNIKNNYQINVPLFLWLTLIFATPTLSYGQGELSLVIITEENASLPGAIVEICSPALDRIQTGISDERGECHFANLPAGKYQIKAEMPSGDITKGPPFKPRILKNIEIQNTTARLKIMLELNVLEEINVAYPRTRVDPTITTLTEQDAIILSKASTSLQEAIASTWDKMAVVTNICDKREILLKASRIWKILNDTGFDLLDSPQAQEKRFMIQAIFDGIERHLGIYKDSISAFDQNALKLKTALYTIANFFKLVSDTGKATIDLRIISYPEGGRLTYRYLYGGPTKEFEERTPTTIKDLYYAPIELNINLEGYNAEKITYDPFLDESRQIDVNLRKKMG